MKNLNQKMIFSITLLIIVMTGASNLVFCQNKVETKLYEFLILVETTDEGIRLICQEGCDFKELTFTLETGNTQAIDRHGMTTLERADSVKDNNLTNFLFTVKRTEDGLSFEGIIGTAWEKLSFSCPENKCHQYIDQNGMTEVK